MLPTFHRRISGLYCNRQRAAHGHTFEHTFDSPGVYKYYCTPHVAMGMKGAIFVGLE
ncbi:plastocyanin/azurin family copper-binding protein [Halalkalicoccus ordinarius]|uniref:plastocyanin/azurin family copper-binding protein n=1 Tax=Halalkalicoccus ordinarius TaxID=3116651 RepID=UPI00300EF30B